MKRIPKVIPTLETKTKKRVAPKESNNPFDRPAHIRNLEAVRKGVVNGDPL